MKGKRMAERRALRAAQEDPGFMAGYEAWRTEMEFRYELFRLGRRPADYAIRLRSGQVVGINVNNSPQGVD